MTFDWTVRLTDIVMICAVIAGPILAVLATEVYRRRKEVSDRREVLFRGLMATRNATLSPHHIESLNLVDTVFHGSATKDRNVVDQWKVYLQHLGDRSYPAQSWEARRADLLHELLQKMSVAVGYSFDLSHIKNGTYYPGGYVTTEQEIADLRKLILKIVSGEESLKVSVLPVNTPESLASHLELQTAVKQLILGRVPIPVTLTNIQKQGEQDGGGQPLLAPLSAESSLTS